MFIGLEAQSFESCPRAGREIWRQQRKGAVGEEKKEIDGERVSNWDQMKDGSDGVIFHCSSVSY